MATSQTNLPGKDGFETLEYMGPSAGTQTFFGDVTGTAYRFDSGRNKVKYVDAQDADFLLSIREGGKNLFIRSAPPEAAELELSKEEEELANPSEPVKAEEEPESDDWNASELDVTLAAERLAGKHGVDLREVTGTGSDGRILKSDVQDYVDSRN